MHAPHFIHREREREQEGMTENEQKEKAHETNLVLPRVLAHPNLMVYA